MEVPLVCHTLPTLYSIVVIQTKAVKPGTGYQGGRVATMQIILHPIKMQEEIFTHYS